MDVERVLRGLKGVRKVGHWQWLARCPCHDDRSPSLSLRQTGVDRLVARCHAGCRQEDVFRALCMLDTDWRPQVRSPSVTPKGRVTRHDDGRRESKALVARLWGEARPLAGTLGERYLRNRGLEAHGLEHCLRFHSDCPFGEGRAPCLIAAYQPIRGLEREVPTAIHRTALTLKGERFDRKMLGAVKGQCVKLARDEDVTTALVIGEGIETVLSSRFLPEIGPTPAWALTSANALETFPVLPGIEVLHILVDHDESGAGQQAARAAALRWVTAGAQVFLVKAMAVGTDINDIIRGGTDGGPGV